MDNSKIERGNEKIAHSNFRKGLSDYNDGENVTHQLGNDDYKNGNNLADPYLTKETLDGKVAAGNDLSEDDVSDDADDEVVEDPQSNDDINYE